MTDPYVARLRRLDSCAVSDARDRPGLADTVVTTLTDLTAAENVALPLILIVGMRHFAMGATMMIEDYAGGTARKMAIIFAYSLSAVIVASGLFALIKIAL